MMQSTRSTWTTNRVFALVLGIVFVLIAIIGFLTPAENSTGVQAIFGLFDVDVVHNLVHLITGIVAIAAAFMGFSVWFNRIFGIIYTLIGILGLIPALYFPSGTYGTDNGLFLGIMHINAGDHVLHLVTGIVALIVGYMLDRTVTRPTAAL